MRAVLFDVDGTLWDSVPVIREVWNRVFAGNPLCGGRQLTPEETYRLMGHTLPEIAEIVLPEVDKQKREQILEEAVEEELKALKEKSGVFYPGVRETFRELADEGYRIGVVSNCQDGYIQVMLAQCGLAELVLDFECSGVTGMTKDRNILLLLQRNGIRREDAVYVGDTAMDETASRRAGIRFVHASYGFGEAERPDAVIRELSELPGVLKAL